MTRMRLYQAVIASAKRSRRVSGGNVAPSFISAPAIIGTFPLSGSPVSFTNGNVSGIPTPTLTQQWLLDGAAISGATNLTYTPVTGDRGHLLSVRQTATNGVGSPANSTSAAVTVAIQPSFSSAPAISGTPRVSSSVGYTSGSFSGSPTPTSSQQWVIDGVDVPGATGTSYTPVIGDLGKTLTVRQTATNTQSPAASSTSSGAVVLAASSNTVTASFSASRTSGTAPLGVLFDATGTTTNVAKANQSANGTAFRQCQYAWSFDDASAGNWVNSGLPRTSQTGGPIAGYMFDSGTKTHAVSLTVTVGLPWGTSTSLAPRQYIVDDIVTQGGNTYYCSIAHTPGTFSTDLGAGRWTLLQSGLIQSTSSQNIAVTSADTTYSGTNTIYVSPSANYTNAPVGSTKQTTIPTLASNRRIMLRGGESYGDINIGGLTNCQVVSDGIGAKPACARLNISGTNNLFKGLSATLGISGFTGTDNAAINNTIAHSDSGAITLYFSNDVNNDGYSQCVRPAFFGNTVIANTTSNASIYGQARNMMMVDNQAGGSAQHTCRIFGSYKGYVAHNQFDGGTFNNTKLTFKFHSLALIQWPTTDNLGRYASEFNVIANNKFGSVGSTQTWIADNCSENFDSTTIEGLSDFIYENNIHIPCPSTTTHFLANGRRMTHRGNSTTSGTYAFGDVCDASGAGGVVGTSGAQSATYRGSWLRPLFLG